MRTLLAILAAVLALYMFPPEARTQGVCWDGTFVRDMKDCPKSPGTKLKANSSGQKPGKTEDFKITTGAGMSRIKDGAILVVSAADGPMPAPALEPKIKSALDAKNVAYSAVSLRSLAEQAARRLATLRANRQTKVCTAQGQPCVTLLRK